MEASSHLQFTLDSRCVFFLLKEEPFNANFQFYQIIWLNKSCFLWKHRTAWWRSVGKLRCWWVLMVKCSFKPSTESPGILLPWAGSRSPGRVNASRVIPQWEFHLGRWMGPRRGTTSPSVHLRPLWAGLFTDTFNAQLFWSLHGNIWCFEQTAALEMEKWVEGKLLFLQLIKKRNH